MFKAFYTLFLGTLSLSVLTTAQDCLLEVPNDPLNTGLFKPWFVSTAPGSAFPCSQLIQGSEVFVEATITDLATCELFVYSPLVIDAGTTPAFPILPAILPAPASWFRRLQKQRARPGWDIRQSWKVRARQAR